MTDETYEGWKNRETWAVSLWINNSQGLQEIAREMVAGLETWAAAKSLESMFDEFSDEVLNGTASIEVRWMVLDIGSFGRVDWHEVAEGIAADVAEAVGQMRAAVEGQVARP